MKLVSHRRAEPRPKLSGVKILIKARRKVLQKTFVDLFEHWFLVTAHAAVDGKDWQNAALVALRTVVVAFAEFPTTVDGYRTVATIGAVVVLEEGVCDMGGDGHGRDY